tara:strand:+ start:150 stop:671 length:522 start_codon:yes stop_codon:yes gene_type:complete
MSVSFLDDDQYIIHLNSSNVSQTQSGVPLTATNDGDFTTDIRPMSLSPLHEWVVGIIDVVMYSPNYKDSSMTPNQEPVVIASDVGIDIRNGTSTNDILYVTKPIVTPTTGILSLYYGEKNMNTAIAWRPIRNREITNIRVRLYLLYSKQLVQWTSGTGLRGYNSITLCIKKVK